MAELDEIWRVQKAFLKVASAPAILCRLVYISDDCGKKKKAKSCKHRQFLKCI